VPGIRAAHVTTEVEARLSREHNDANVLTLGSGAQDCGSLAQQFLRGRPPRAPRRKDRSPRQGRFSRRKVLEIHPWKRFHKSFFARAWLQRCRSAASFRGGFSRGGIRVELFAGLGWGTKIGLSRLAEGESPARRSRVEQKQSTSPVRDDPVSSP